LSFFFYWQKSGGEDVWQPALAETREQLVIKEQPRFVTVLDVSAVSDSTFTREQIDQLRYRGPLYFDFDAPDIEIAIEKFTQFLGRLIEVDVDPEMCRLFASGGRGFHIEVPQEVFMPKHPKQGVPRLPLIYKEMAQELYVDTLDLRVYSARKGRMWRTPGVKRENGKFKVPLTFDEAGNMTPANYELLCSSPRQAVGLKPPELSNKLAVMFAAAESKVEAAAKRKKASKQDATLLAKFKGELPPSLLRVLAGEIVAPGTGFHKIALQAAITANAIGMPEERLLQIAEGVVEKHQSDGHRYNTPAKRRAELQRMYRYTQDNVCYDYRRDAVRSLLPMGTPAPDLDGLTEEVAGEVTAQGDNGNSEGLLSGVIVTERGVFKKVEEGSVMLSDISYKDANLLYSIDTGHAQGFECQVLLNGKSRGRHLVELPTFLSKQRYVQHCMSHMGIFRGNDNEVQAVAAILRDTAMKNNKVTYIIGREGLDLIQRPEVTEKQLDFVWSTPETVETDSPVLYKFSSPFGKLGMFKSDLTDAPDLEAGPDTEKVIDALFRFNEPYAVANLLGWFVSAFHRQVYHQIYQQFPLLQIVGQSGSGKTTTVGHLLHLHYHLASPLVLQADSSTKFAIQSAVQSSASIPVVLDEFKMRQFGPGKYSALMQMFRSSYSAQTIGKGGMSNDLNSSWKDITLLAFSAPIVFLTEALETETALLERTVSVALTKSALTGREKANNLLQEQRGVIASLGKEIVRATFAMSLEAFKEQVEVHRAEANKIAFKRNNHRVVFNLAVVMMGLEFLDRVLAHHFKSRFSEQLAQLREVAKDISKHVSVTVMPEAAKVLNILAHMTKTEDSLSEFGLSEGKDYIQTPEYLDLQMRNCYYKYVAWARRKGQVPMYDNEEAFTHGLGNFSPAFDRAAINSELKKDGMTKVIRFSSPLLREEGVEEFGRS
jgi:hypothetical protein